MLKIWLMASILMIAGCIRAIPNGDLIRNDSNAKESAIVLEKWKKAVVHLEGASDSEHVYDYINKLHKLRQQFEKKEITQEQFIQDSIHHSRDIRYHGTALFVAHHGKRYLITARHVVFDENSAIREFREEENKIKSWPQDRKAEMLRSAQERLSDRIFNMIFRVPSLDEMLTISSNTHREFLMNLGAGGPTTYTFSTPDFDLAVISLDQRKSRFAEELTKVGYVPIDSGFIGEGPEAEGDDVFTVGYPSATALLGQVNLQQEMLNWSSSYFSLPVFAFGKVSMVSNQLPFFWADMSIFPGNSGGPVIWNGKLIGIVSAQATLPIDGLPKLRTRIPFAKIINAKYVRQLLEIQAEKDRQWSR